MNDRCRSTSGNMAEDVTTTPFFTVENPSESTRGSAYTIKAEQNDDDDVNAKNKCFGTCTSFHCGSIWRRGADCDRGIAQKIWGSRHWERSYSGEQCGGRQDVMYTKCTKRVHKHLIHSMSQIDEGVITTGLAPLQELRIYV